MKESSYERYAEIRDSLGYTDYKVSKLAGLKGTATISNWKNGKYVPKEDKIREIAKVLNTTSEYLLTGEHPDNVQTALILASFGNDPKKMKIAQGMEKLSSDKLEEFENYLNYLLSQTESEDK